MFNPHRLAEDLRHFIRRLLTAFRHGEYSYIFATAAGACIGAVVFLASQEDRFPKHRSTLLLVGAVVSVLTLLALVVSVYREDNKKQSSLADREPVPTRRSQKLRRLTTGVSLGLIVTSGLIAGSAFGFFLGRQTKVIPDPPIAEEYLRSRGYPPDLLEIQSRLTRLKLGPSVTRLDWLNAPNLRSLDISDTAVKAVKDWPPRLRELNINGAGIGEMPPFPETLLALDLGTGSSFEQLEALPVNLQSLEAAPMELDRRVVLPDSLEDLALAHDPKEWLDGLPARLSKLSLAFSPFSITAQPTPLLRHLVLKKPAGEVDLGLLPDSLKELEIEGGTISNLDGLPPGIRTLTLRRLDVSTLCPLRSVALDTLSLVSVGVSSGEDGFCGLPPSLRSLTHTSKEDSLYLSFEDLPPSLQSLEIGFPRSERFAELPAFLKSLTLNKPNIEQIQGIPTSLTSLEIAEGGELYFREELPASLQRLELRDCQSLALRAFPSGLKQLDLSGCDLDDLPRLPEGLLKLDLSRTGLKVLPELPASLQELNIANTQVSLPQELPASLIGLTLHEGQAESLKAVPGCLRELAFVERHDSD